MRSPAHTTDEPRIRAFLALELPSDVRERIGMLQKRLRHRLRGGVRWVNPGDIHLTLKFFGAIPVRDISAVRAVVGEITARTAPLALQARRLGVFPNANKPRVLWLGLDGDVVLLTQLQRVIDERLAECDFAIEARPFHPHLTLGRLKTPAALPGLKEIVAQCAECTAGTFIARELTLMKSELMPQGAVYTVLARFPLHLVLGTGGPCPIIAP